MIGGEIAPWRAIGGVWRAEADKTENYVYLGGNMAIDKLEKVPLLYHFTDRRNLSVIKEMGGLHPLSQLDQKKVKIPAPGGNEWSRDADALKGMGNYVHLCFRDTHPMEFIARQEGRITDTIFLQINPSVMQLEGVRFTNDVANKAGVESVAIAEAEALIDFEILYTWTDWREPAIKARLAQAEKYEVLVPHVIPLAYIRNI